MGQAKGYHGADSAKYKMSGSEGAVTAMPYLKSVSLDRQINSTSQYANNRQIIKVSTDTPAIWALRRGIPNWKRHSV